MAIPLLAAAAALVRTAIGGSTRVLSLGARSVTGRGAAFGRSAGGRVTPPTPHIPRARPVGGGGPRNSKRRGGGHDSSRTPDDRKTTLLDRLWTYDSGWNLASRLSTLASENTSSFMHTIKVDVIGGPEADLRRVWYLACAAAFGRYRNRVSGIGDGSFEGVWDVTNKSVSVSIGYINSGLADKIYDLPGRVLEFGNKLIDKGLEITDSISPWIVGGAFSVAAVRRTAAGAIAPGVGRGRSEFTGIQFVQTGPDQVTVGGAWPVWLRDGDIADVETVESGAADVEEKCAATDRGPVFKFRENPAINVLGEVPQPHADGKSLLIPWGRVGPAGEKSDTRSVRDYETVIGRRRIPTLPDDGRIITTGEKRDPSVQPPRPVIDGKSRMSILAAIHGALHSPCYAPEGVGCSVTPLFSAGQSLYPPGRGVEDNNLLGRTDFSKLLAGATRTSDTEKLSAATEPTLVH